MSTNLQELATKLKDALSVDEVDTNHVTKIMEGYTSNPKDWQKFTLWDQHKYTRTLVDEGNGKFNLLILCWGEGQGSPIHDHSNSHCFMKILQGTLKETRYAWPEEGQKNEMVPTEDFCLNRDKVKYMSDKLGLHRVENPSHTEKAISLHLYSPPFDVCHCFDDRTSKKRSCEITFIDKTQEGL